MFLLKYKFREVCFLQHKTEIKQSKQKNIYINNATGLKITKQAFQLVKWQLFLLVLDKMNLMGWQFPEWQDWLAYFQRFAAWLGDCSLRCFSQLSTSSAPTAWGTKCAMRWKPFPPEEAPWSCPDAVDKVKGLPSATQRKRKHTGPRKSANGWTLKEGFLLSTEVQSAGFAFPTTVA